MDYLELVKTVGILTGISGGLALLMSIAQNTVGNYGEKTIVINGEKELTMDGGDTLLAGLIDNEVFLPSACGGKGTCGYCKCKVVSGGGQILPTETGLVTPDEIAQGIRLSCQLKVKEDIKIEVPEEYLSLKQYETTVTRIDDVTDTIKHVFLKLPEGEEIIFKPGQYVQILAPEYQGNDEEVYRAYSIASSPSKTTEIELLIGYIPEGIATTYVHQHLQVGDKLNIIGPFGHFFYQDTDKPMIFVGSGTGVAPNLSIVRYMQENNIQRPGLFLSAGRHVDDLFLQDEFAQMKKALPNLNFRFSVTQPEPGAWNGPTEWVTDGLKLLIDDASGMEAYLCGSPVTIEQIVTILKEKGMSEDQIFYDKFQ